MKLSLAWIPTVPHGPNIVGLRPTDMLVFLLTPR
jgi:hypothetical protein